MPGKNEEERSWYVVNTYSGHENKKQNTNTTIALYANSFLFGVYFYGSDAIIAVILKALGMN